MVTSDHLVSFAMTCSLIHKLSHSSLESHGERLELFTSVSFGGCYHHNEEYHPLKFLDLINQDWKIASYPKIFSVECCGKDEFDEEEWEKQYGANERRKKEKRFKKDLIRRTHESQYFTGVRRVDCLTLFSESLRGVTLAVLITILPNIKTLAMTDYTWNVDLFQ